MLLRFALGSVLNVKPQSIVLRERFEDSPVLVAPANPAVAFSISHSGPWVACAASLRGPVGLDIECIDGGRDVVALAEQAFDAATAAQVGTCRGEARLQAFYRHWCLYEAGIKLGVASAADHVYTHPGLALALRCARPLVAPRLDIVDLGAGMPGP